MKVLYLDFDGVLHHDAVYRRRRGGIYIDEDIAPGRTLFEWQHHLVEALAPFPEVRIVLSTSWVRVLDFKQARGRLCPALAERVIGATYHSRFHREVERHLAAPVRGEEVLADVGRRLPSAWVAVDDADEGWSAPARQHLVLCHPQRGLGDADARKRLESVFEQHFGSSIGSCD